MKETENNNLKIKLFAFITTTLHLTAKYIFLSYCYKLGL